MLDQSTPSPEANTTPATTMEETIAEKTAEIAQKMHLETWQLVAILVGKKTLHLLLC